MIQDCRKLPSGRKGRSTIHSFCKILIASIPLMLAVSSLETKILPEIELISDLSLPDKSFAYFNFTVTNNTYTDLQGDKAHLVFNVYATSFDSDPDIYISKT